MVKNTRLLLLLLCTLLLAWKNYIPPRLLPGKYVNNNTGPVLEGPRPIAEGVDTLVLYADYTFTSKTWGSGTYVLELGFFEKQIDLSYTYQLGKAGCTMSVSKSFLGKPRIWLNRDLGFYFEKVK